MSVDVLDEEWLLSEEQVRSLLEWMRGHTGANRSVYPFMRTMAEQALRPGEARATSCPLPFALRPAQGANQRLRQLQLAPHHRRVHRDRKSVV